MTKRASTDGYASEAPIMLKRYESASSERVHGEMLQWFPKAPAYVLDIGAGTGRDAAYFAAQGHRVLAVEPVAEMRDGAQRLHPDPEIEWLDDRLPDLSKVAARDEHFDMIMLSAVWMHLDADERASGMTRIVSLLKPGGRLFMSLRHGLVPEGRRMFEVTGAETEALATEQGLKLLHQARVPSIGAANIANGVEWTVLAFEKR